MQRHVLLSVRLGFLISGYTLPGLAKYKAGAIEKPTVEQLVAALPALVIPSA